MRNARRISTALLFVLFARFASAAHAAPDKAPRAAYDAYLTALAKRDGQAAANLVTSRTFDYYEKMRVAALGAPAAAVKQMAFSDEVMVLALRGAKKPAELRALDGRQIFVEAIERGWIDASMLGGVKLGKIIVHGDVANGQLMKGDQDLHFAWTLEREKGAWKNDLRSVVDIIDIVVNQQLKAAGVDEAQLVQTSVESFIGRKLTAADWAPPPQK